MRFKVDENLPVEVAQLLRQNGHDAATVLEQRLGGHPDQDIAAVCIAEARCLITLDVDFANLRQYPPANHCGLVVLRLARQDKPTVLDMMRRILPLLSCEPLDRKLWIVEMDRIRIRD
jgi:predicted nuclease of predicted toxin-antitoxin system